MRITVRYLGQAQRAAGRAAEVVDAADGCTVAAVLHTLAGRQAALRGLLLAADGSPRPSMLFFVGDEQCAADRALRDGDVLTVLAPMAGG